MNTFKAVCKLPIVSCENKADKVFTTASQNSVKIVNTVKATKPGTSGTVVVQEDILWLKVLVPKSQFAASRAKSTVPTPLNNSVAKLSDHDAAQGQKSPPDKNSTDADEKSLLCHEKFEDFSDSCGKDSTDTVKPLSTFHNLLTGSQDQVMSHSKSKSKKSGIPKAMKGILQDSKEYAAHVLAEQKYFMENK